MRLHLILDPRLPPQRLVELGKLAEHHGLEAVWTSSLLGARDPFVAYMPLALATRTLKMGPIAVNPFDTHPARLAMSLLTLNEAAGGRAQIVLGGGGEALEGLGLKPQRRVLAVREAVNLLREAASGRRFDFQGEMFRTKGFACDWVSAPPPMIWIGANGPQMMAMAAKIADGIMLSDVPPALLKPPIDAARATRRSAGGPLAETPLLFNNFVAWHVYEDEARARAEARRWLAFRGLFRRWVCTTFITDAEYDLIEARQAAFYRWATGGPPVDDLPDSLLDQLVKHLTLTSTASRLDPVIHHLQAMRDAGLTHVSLRLYQDIERSIEIIGRDLAPQLAD
ncbi:MAG: LLM class flavin-dependent oxidoreductase [Steroidobacteraceae bacterium]|nr:LLM class flavin-dependent oxidoreductase [Nevskiaceae bacterium]MCP5340396.1 LLM class flavin-dependent oxidoreductase [Nevskiaceae bacterium]MCP5360236.1 LLM class flavin-dependent oxidoreductase [Nevskiaceae bacterium]MCP5466627.1 LLM class flavin-dependent oxidoreductase [Nevskiaceae bacterium]